MPFQAARGRRFQHSIRPLGIRALRQETWFLARVFRAALAAGFRGVVSFSDPVVRTDSNGRKVFNGHHGSVYQAANSLFLGRTRPRWRLLFPDGTELSEQAIGKVRHDKRGHAYVERRLCDWGASPRRRGESGEAFLYRAIPAARMRQWHHDGLLRYGFQLGANARQRAAVRVARTPLPYPKPDLAVQLDLDLDLDLFGAPRDRAADRAADRGGRDRHARGRHLPVARAVRPRQRHRRCRTRPWSRPRTRRPAALAAPRARGAPARRAGRPRRADRDRAWAIAAGTAARPHHVLLLLVSTSEPTHLELRLADAADLLASLDEPASLICTDPPYGLRRGSANAVDRRVYRRDQTRVVPGYVDVDPGRYAEFTHRWVTAAAAALRPGGYLAVVTAAQWHPRAVMGTRRVDPSTSHHQRPAP